MTFAQSPLVPSKTTSATNDGTLIATEAQVYLKADITTTYTKTEADSRYLNLSGGTMTGTITGAERSGLWIHTFTSNTAFYVPPNTDQIPGNSAQGVLSWRTGLGDGYCINNLSGDNKTHLQWTTKSNIDNDINTSSDVFTIENGVMNINGTATNATRLTSIGTEINPHTNRTTLEYSQGSGITGAPTTDWHSYITMLHENTNGYFTQLASSFHSDDLYWRRKSNGSVGSWKRIAFSDEVNMKLSLSGGTITGIVNVPTPSLPT
jgi:hypothetical protein